MVSAEYETRTRASKHLHERLRKSLPAGETRSVTYFPPYPVAIARGQGAMLWDVDGNEYLDVLNNYTALVHGHTFAPVLEAVGAALVEGSVFPAPHERQAHLAELLIERYSAIELVRFTNSGTEAALLAARLARACTMRPNLIVFDGAYHGTAPDFVDAPPTTIRVPYNDLNRLAAALDESVAAVFVEPFLGSGGVIPSQTGFLPAVEELAHRVGALFVLDEVQSLRNAYHGVHGEMGLRPDLVLMGKIVGGGLPVGAVGGARTVMMRTAADSPDAVVHSGTFNGNPLTMAAGVPYLSHLDHAAIERLNNLSQGLAQRIEAAGAARDLPVTVTRSGSIMQVHFTDRVPTSASDRSAESNESSATLHLALLLEGIYAAPRGMLNLSTAVTDADMEFIAHGYERALDRLAGTVRDHPGQRGAIHAVR